MLIRIEIDDRQVQDALTRLLELGRSPRRVMREIANYGENSTRQRFNDQQGPDGEAWIPSQRVKKQGGKTLIKDRHLLDSIVSSADGESAEWGSNMIYAAIHQFGGEIHKAAQSRLVRHRTDAKGRLLKNAKGLLIFAKDKHKRATERWFEQGAHTIDMPARPYLGINAEDEANVIDMINRHLSAAVNGS